MRHRKLGVTGTAGGTGRASPGRDDRGAGHRHAAAERMWREQTGSLLVTQDGRLIGIITERDVLRAVALGADPDRATVDEAMTVDVFTVASHMQSDVAGRGR